MKRITETKGDLASRVIREAADYMRHLTENPSKMAQSEDQLEAHIRAFVRLMNAVQRAKTNRYEAPYLERLTKAAQRWNSLAH